MAEKKTRKLTSKQQKLVEGIIAGKSGAQAARDAGYSPEHPENAGQSGYQAMKEIGDRVRTAMDSAGFTLEQLIEKHLRSKLEARETKFFPWRKSVQKKSGKKGAEVIVEDTIQVIDVWHTEALGIQLGALDIAFRLRGDYARKKLDSDPDESVPTPRKACSKSWVH